jgi:hypothetical protein
LPFLAWHTHTQDTQKYKKIPKKIDKRKREEVQKTQTEKQPKMGARTVTMRPNTYSDNETKDKGANGRIMKMRQRTRDTTIKKRGQGKGKQHKDQRQKGKRERDKEKTRTNGRRRQRDQRQREI